jgi:PAS domain S-box-containing protein
MTPISLPLGVVVSASSPGEFEGQLARILGPEAARHEVGQALADLEMAEDERSPNELRRLRERIERNLSGLMGPMLARMIVDQRLQMGTQARTALADNIRFIEERVEQSRTELRGLAAQLDSLRRYHQEILSDLPIGACSLSSDGRVISWNMAIETISGIRRDTARAKPLDKLPLPWGSLLHAFLEGKDLHQHKVSIEVEDRPRWLNLHKASIREPGGTVILVEDLTDVQTLEAELAHSDRLASIGRLAAGVAHEIGNPVTGIACIAQNLKTESEDPDTHGAIAQILGETERIRAIVQSLVGFSHGGNPLAQNRASVRLHGCIDEAAKLVRLSHAGKQVNIENHCPDDLVVLGDQPRLVQVFVNLLSNACDASTAGDRIEVNAYKTSESVTVEIIDQGSGIARSVLEQVFEPFVTTKAPGQGTGLGLAMVYSIVQEHGGSVQVAETSAQGTRIVVQLPPEDAGDAPHAPRFGHEAV